MNNDSWRVKTTRGTFVLRIYKNAGARQYVGFEHALLSELARSSRLSFALPAPLTTESGETVVDVDEALASLVPLIPGRHPKWGDIREARLAGSALGQLDAALSTIRLDPPRFGPTGYGDLCRVHPAIGHPLEPAEMLVLRGESRARYERLVGASEATYPGLYGTLPTQIIHSDYVRSNVLLRSGRVVGVLDFEFSAPDLRVMDFAIGLYHFCMVNALDNSDVVWRLLDAFAGGYRERVSLSGPEIEALPTVLLRRRLVVFLHWAGRWKIGLSKDHALHENLAATVRLADWLEEHGDALANQVCARI